VHYLTDPFRPGERRLIWLAALVLLPVFFFPVLPIWIMKLWAPQYREGLTLTILANNIRGDLQSINTLNHYVGMKHISADDFKEFHYLPQALSLFGVLAVLGAWLNRRWIAILGWLVFTGFAIYMFSDYARWLYDYGHNLDPRAPIKLPLFTPPLIGLKQMANFKVLSIPGPGTLLLGVAWLLGPLAILLEIRAGASGTAPAAARRDATRD
jgi:copper chaperone NosL